jgi:tetratricopeptide (TPR) repeat protein
LPSLEPVPQEDSNVIGPTAEGSWQAKITTPTEGRYRIVVKGQIGKQPPLAREVTVICIGKANVFAKRMKEDRSIRGVGQIPHRPPAVIDKVLLISQLSDTESRLFDFLDNGNWEQSLRLITQAMDIIDPALLHSPDDLYFQNQRAYFFKNYAIVMRETKREGEVKRALDESETMFKAILDQEQTDAGAWNGMGSVLIMQGMPEDALFYIREALKLKPDYWQAKNDEQLALNMIERVDAKEPP